MVFIPHEEGSKYVFLISYYRTLCTLFWNYADVAVLWNCISDEKPSQNLKPDTS